MIRIRHRYEEEAAIEEDWYARRVGRAHGDGQEGSGK